MARRMSSCDDALPSPLPLIYVLVTCVPNRINKRKTGFSTVRKHIIRHREIFEVSLRNSTANFRKTAVCGGSPARFSENFKTDRKSFLISPKSCTLYGFEQSISRSIIWVYCCFATARLNVRTNTLSNTVLLSRRTCCCLLDPAGAEFCLTARYTQVQTRNRTGSGLKQTEHL